VDETHLAKVVPEEMKKMLKAMQRKYLSETYHYMIVDTVCDGYSVKEMMLTYIRYLQRVIQRAPESLNSVQKSLVEQLPSLLGLRKKPKRDTSPLREKVIKSSSQEAD
jgi:hypothetical protein